MPRSGHSSRRLIASLSGLAVAASGLSVLATPAAQANPSGTGLVISEAYVNGGSSNAIYTHKFVEIYNPTDLAVDLTGMSLQYRSPTWTGDASGRVALSGSVAPGEYFLLEGGSNGSNGSALPAPDQSSGSINPGSAGGTLFLASVTTAVDPDPADAAGAVVDLIGWGTSNRAEGTVATGNGVTASYQRIEGEVVNQDTDDNAADFVAASPSPDGPYVAPPPPPEPTEVAIAEIQGNGSTSPLVGDRVTSTGVVTAAPQHLYGFYLQTPGTGDETDRTSSDGVFVYYPFGSGTVSVEPGDHVRVTGEVDEHAGQTQVVSSAAETVVLEEPAEGVVAYSGAWPATAAAKEALEGMLFRPEGEFTVTNTYSTNQYGEVGLARGPKPLLQPTEVADAQDADAIAAVVADNAARAITLDDGSGTSYTSSSNQRLTPPYVSHEAPVRVGASATFIDDVILTEGGSPSAPTYRFQPLRTVSGPDYTATSPAVFENTRTAAPDRTAINARGAADLEVASFNVLNYFTTLGDADDDNVGDGGCVAYNDRNGDGNNVRGGCAQRGAWDPQDFERQQEKIVAAINALDADVVGLMEIENSLVLGEDAGEATESLVAALNAAAGAGTWAANPSSTELPPADEMDVISNAIIYQPAAVERVGEARALGDQSSSGQAFANAREPIAQVFRPVGGGEPFLLVVNHFKSKGSGVDDGTGQGNANPDRIRQATALRDWVPTVQAESGTEAVLLVGDFNSYSREDPLEILYEAGYTNVQDEASQEEYSYSFSGLSGSLDHALANDAAMAFLTGSDIWDVNAGESLAMEYSRWNYHGTDFHRPGPYRSSDHDPVVLGLDLLTEDAPAELLETTVKAFHYPKKVRAGQTRPRLTVKVSADGVTPTGWVQVAIPGKGVKRVKLENGKAKLVLPVFNRPGRKILRITYIGDAQVDSARVEHVVTVVRSNKK